MKETYKLSTELDRLIAEYYKAEIISQGKRRVKENIKRKLVNKM